MSPSLSYGGEYDFTVRSIPDGTTLRANMECLRTHSEVFAGMFDCHVQNSESRDGFPNEDSEILCLDERASTLQVLLRLLHTTPSAAKPSPSGLHPSPSSRDPAIPFPLLPALFVLADKYMLSDQIVQALRASLAAYTSEQPLRVYGYAMQLGFSELAAEASTYLLYPPLAEYTAAEIAVIPTVQAYHQLGQLQAYRVKRLRELLQAEAIFPLGYGKCPKHARRTASLWGDRKKLIYAEIHAASNPAAEMAKLSTSLSGCPTCGKALRAAVEMLNYKCSKIPRSVDQLIL